MKVKTLIGAGAAAVILAVAVVGGAQAHKKKTPETMTEEAMKKQDMMAEEKAMKKQKMMAEEAMKKKQMMAASDGKKKPPFGNPDDVAFSKALWNAMVAAQLAGPNAIRTNVYEGQEPHGAALETIFANLSVEGRTGTVAIKRNYGPAGVDLDEVTMDRAKSLGSVTVMYKREKGYDTANKNWFWVKYLPDGSLDKNPKGMMLAGRVAKGAKKGCIACHSLAEGDMVYTNVTITD